MIIIWTFNFLFFLCVTGAPKTECDVSEMGKLRCKFSKNINSTQTDFSVYFHSDEGHEELLVDCVWVDDDFQCLERKDFECKKPVSHIVEIRVPAQFIIRSGTYRCIAGLGHGNIKTCRVQKSHQETQTKLQQKTTQKSQVTKQNSNNKEITKADHGNHPNDKEEVSSRSWHAAIGPASGVIIGPVLMLVIFLIWKICERKGWLSRICCICFVTHEAKMNYV